MGDKLFRSLLLLFIVSQAWVVFESNRSHHALMKAVLDNLIAECSVVPMPEWCKSKH